MILTPVASGGRLPIQHIHTYLAHAGRRSGAAPHINGAAVPLAGKMFNLLDNIYTRSDSECDIDIAFRPADDGAQTNPCRDLIVGYLANPTLNNGRLIAERLETLTDMRSGLGLLFLIAGKEGRDHKIVISRFPTDSAILADEDQAALTVQFLERVFMKSKFSYKAVAYRGPSLRGDFWTGCAIDKQIGDQLGGLSNYWIADFLHSDFSITPAAGTRRLGGALRAAAKKSNLDVKNEIASAVTLAGNLRPQQISIAEFEERFGLSDVARQAINSELKSPHLAQERFQFDVTEFKEVVGYRSIELNNGGMLTAPSSDFDKVFERHVINEEQNEVRYSTQGKVVGEKLTKVR